MAIESPAKMLKAAGINVRKDMTPKKNRLYSIVKKMSRTLKRTSASKESFQKRLQYAEKFSKAKGLEENLGTLNEISAQFIRCQLREAGNSPRQHRFTIEEKIMAFSLLKQSPKAYRFLSKIFTLPSKSTLGNFLNEVNFEAGINKEIFEALRETASKLKPSDRFITLMWDEMSLAPALEMNERKGHIEGFEEFGDNEKVFNIADHVLVFMVRGLKTKLKQPICYAFSSKGGAKGHQIKKMVKAILHELLQIGLKPIATLCDQAASNVKVLNTLLKETREKHLRERTEYKEGSFEVDNFCIYPIFDPPHLLKCIRNNFLGKTLLFKVDGVEKMAKWAHIVKLYEMDNGTNMLDGLRALPHLTDEHVYADKVKKMKVKHAAQIFSHRLAVTLQLAANFGKIH